MMNSTEHQGSTERTNRPNPWNSSLDPAQATTPGIELTPMTPKMIFALLRCVINQGHSDVFTVKTTPARMSTTSTVSTALTTDKE